MSMNEQEDKIIQWLIDAIEHTNKAVQLLVSNTECSREDIRCLNACVALSGKCLEQARKYRETK